MKPSTRGLVWLRSEKEKHQFDWNTWLDRVVKMPVHMIHSEAQYVMDTMISDTSYANPVDSGIAGWFDRYPRIPYGRATAYTQQNFEKFQLAYPFLQQLSLAFKTLLPNRYAQQKACIDKLDPK